MDIAFLPHPARGIRWKSVSPFHERRHDNEMIRVSLITRMTKRREAARSIVAGDALPRTMRFDFAIAKIGEIRLVLEIFEQILDNFLDEFKTSSDSSFAWRAFSARCYLWDFGGIFNRAANNRDMASSADSPSKLDQVAWGRGEHWLVITPAENFRHPNDNYKIAASFDLGPQRLPPNGQ